MKLLDKNLDIAIAIIVEIGVSREEDSDGALHGSSWRPNPGG